MKEKVGGLKRELIQKLNYIFINGLVRLWNLRNIYTEYLMQEVDFCLSLGQVPNFGVMVTPHFLQCSSCFQDRSVASHTQILQILVRWYLRHSAVCAIHGLCKQRVIFTRSLLCTAQSMDCTNPCFATSIYVYVKNCT